MPDTGLPPRPGVPARRPDPTNPSPEAAYPGQGRTHAAPEPAALIALLAAAALDTPGVIRLEPTLKNALRRLKGGDLSEPDGITIITKDGKSTVTIDIAVSSDPCALDTACALQQGARQVLQSGWSRYATVRVNVLSIESPPPIPKS